MELISDFLCADCHKRFDRPQVFHYDTGEFRCISCAKTDKTLRDEHNLPPRKFMFNNERQHYTGEA